MVRDRQALEADEARRLALYALRSAAATRRRPPEGENREDYRLAFQRDRDRITHSRAFRRLKHKTQVFVPHIADHPRTRLTHTLEVAQLGRTIARALGLNEDLVEAIALGHDLGHTAFGHTGEAVLSEILQGRNREVVLPTEVVGGVGDFKHNYQSVRVVDLLERRYSHPGLNLSDQVREGILKHTGWRRDFEFPLPSHEGLNLDSPCFPEGQVVAVADEIAQQTHDLEDGLRAGSAQLEAVEQLQVARLAVEELADTYHSERRQWRRQSMLIRSVIHLLVTDVIGSTLKRLQEFLSRHEISEHEAFTSVARQLPHTTVWFSDRVEPLFDDLKSFIYQFIINHWQVNRQDWRARKVIIALFKAFWSNPLNLPTYVLLRAKEELHVPFLRDIPMASVAAEVEASYHSNPGFVRLVADHIAGMSDRFALEEYHSLEQPDIEQRFVGDVR
jgi:dGTPase